MKFKVTKKNIFQNYIDTDDYHEMVKFVHEDVMYALEETNIFDEEEIAVILELLVEDEDWEKVISIMQSCRFVFQVNVPHTDLSSLI
tara:strand:+ start:532 stop:792 length:261 start_codon:yes stop_codon:yes gene_type:complete